MTAEGAALDGFLALLAHDLRAPLLALDGDLALLLRDPRKLGPLTPAQERALARARRSALRVRRLVDEIVEAARAGAHLPRWERTTPAAIIREAVEQALAAGASRGGLDAAANGGDLDDLREALAREGIAIEGARATLHAPLVTDKLWLVRALVNVVANALEHAPRPVRIRAARSKGRLALAVIDRGPGIPEALREVVFEPFRRLEPAEARGRRGSGLGLAAARTLVEALGGTIHAEAGARGRGTAMVIRVPWRRSRS